MELFWSHQNIFFPLTFSMPYPQTNARLCDDNLHKTFTFCTQLNFHRYMNPEKHFFSCLTCMKEFSLKRDVYVEKI